MSAYWVVQHSWCWTLFKALWHLLWTKLTFLFHSATTFYQALWAGSASFDGMQYFMYVLIYVSAYWVVKHAWCWMLFKGLCRDLRAKGQSTAQRQQEIIRTQTLWPGKDIWNTSLCRLVQFKFSKKAEQIWRSLPFDLTSKICIKCRKHWKSYVSFHLSGQIWQIWLIWAVLKLFSKLTVIPPAKDNFLYQFSTRYSN